MNRIVIAVTALAVAASMALPALAPAHPGHSHQHQTKKGKNKKHKKGKKGKGSQKGKRGKAQSSKQATKKVAINFAAFAGKTPVSCRKPIRGLGTTSRSANLTDLRFYVSDVQLLRKGGGAVSVKLPAGSKWSYTKGKAAVTLIDLENGTGSCAGEGTKGMNASVRGTVPKGSYTGVRYSVSVPDSLGHTDVTAMPSPLNLTSMAWSWQAGRKFMKIEVSEDGGPAWGSKTFFVHIGATGCKGDPAAGETAKCSLPTATG